MKSFLATAFFLHLLLGNVALGKVHAMAAEVPPPAEALRMTPAEGVLMSIALAPVEFPAPSCTDGAESTPSCPTAQCFHGSDDAEHPEETLFLVRAVAESTLAFGAPLPSAPDILSTLPTTREQRSPALAFAFSSVILRE